MLFFNKKLREIFLNFFVVVVVVNSSLNSVGGREKTRILDVPYFRQVTDFSCGDASLQMLLSYWGVNVSQYSLMDVMRSTIEEGL
jgi:predicted double-glycine peptidase